MLANHRITALILAVLMMPFGVAIYKDATQEKSDLDEYAAEHRQTEQLRQAEYDYEENDDSEFATAMDASFFEELFFDNGHATAPTLSGALSGFVIGESPDSILQRNGSYNDWELIGYDNVEVEISFRVGLQLAVSFIDDGTALKTLTAQWGQPEIPGAGGYRDYYYWFNPKTKTVAELTTDLAGHSLLSFSPYLELHDFISPQTPLFSFESVNLLDLNTAEQLAMLQEGETTSLPHIRGCFDEVTAEFGIDNGRVESVEIEMELTSAKSAELLKLLSTKYGSPKHNGLAETYTYHVKGRVITLAVDINGWNLITVQRR